MADNTLSFDSTYKNMHEDYHCLIKKRFDVFHSLVAQVKDLAQRNNYDAAAAYAEIAAFYAASQHPGLFVSPELEHILLTIGRRSVPTNLYPTKNTSLPRKPKNVLHVASWVSSIGGHTKMLYRWIQQDKEHCYSVVLTRQGLMEVPKKLKEAVLNSNGKIYVLNTRIGSLICWAKLLRKIAASMDTVVLHTSSDDVIPTIAFANKDQCPPIIYLNQADHLFWLGVGISDVVVNLRKSGMQLSQERRGIEAKRNLLLPITLTPTNRTLSRTEAKRQMGFPENSVLLLSIARGTKYKTIDGISFADAHVSLLEQHERAILVVIGPGNSEDWSVAIKRTQGRIRVFGEREDTALFYEAADIYVDSFPIASNTSLLEAGSYGVPLVSRYPYSQAYSILGADSPGLDDKIIRAGDLQEYTAVLSRLVEDEEFRLYLGEATRRQIAEKHLGSNWQRFLHDVYKCAATTPRITVTLPSIDQMFLDETDVLLTRAFFQENMDINRLIQSRMKIMPLGQRLPLLPQLLKTRRFRQLSLLLPEWLYLRLRSSLPF